MRFGLARLGKRNLSAVHRPQPRSAVPKDSGQNPAGAMQLIDTFSALADKANLDNLHMIDDSSTSENMTPAQFKDFGVSQNFVHDFVKTGMKYKGQTPQGGQAGEAAATLKSLALRAMDSALTAGERYQASAELARTVQFYKQQKDKAVAQAKELASTAGVGAAVQATGAAGTMALGLAAAAAMTAKAANAFVGGKIDKWKQDSIRQEQIKQLKAQREQSKDVRVQHQQIAKQRHADAIAAQRQKQKTKQEFADLLAAEKWKQKHPSGGLPSGSAITSTNQNPFQLIQGSFNQPRPVSGPPGPSGGQGPSGDSGQPWIPQPNMPQNPSSQPQSDLNASFWNQTQADLANQQHESDAIQAGITGHLTSGGAFETGSSWDTGEEMNWTPPFAQPTQQAPTQWDSGGNEAAYHNPSMFDEAGGHPTPTSDIQFGGGSNSGNTGGGSQVPTGFFFGMGSLGRRRKRKNTPKVETSPIVSPPEYTGIFSNQWFSDQYHATPSTWRKYLLFSTWYQLPHDGESLAAVARGENPQARALISDMLQRDKSGPQGRFTWIPPDTATWSNRCPADPFTGVRNQSCITGSLQQSGAIQQTNAGSVLPDSFDVLVGGSQFSDEVRNLNGMSEGEDFMGLEGMDNIFSIFGSKPKPKKKTPAQIAAAKYAKDQKIAEKQAADAAQTSYMSPLLKTALYVAMGGAVLYIASGYFGKGKKKDIV